MVDLPTKPENHFSSEKTELWEKIIKCGIISKKVILADFQKIDDFSVLEPKYVFSEKVVDLPTKPENHFSSEKIEL